MAEPQYAFNDPGSPRTSGKHPALLFDAEQRGLSAHDVVDSELLRQSAALSHEQHQKLRMLARDLDAAENRNLAALETHITEMTRLADENKALRIQLSTMTAEVGGLAESEAATEEALQEMARRLELAEMGVRDREQRLQELLPLAERLPGENFRLTAENQELISEVSKLKQRLASIEPSQRVEEFRQQLNDVQTDLIRHQSILHAAQRTAEESRASEKNSLLLETQRLEQTITIDHQREEMRRLYRVIDAVNREKALLPPTVLAAAFPMFGTATGQYALPSSETEKLKELIERLELASKATPPVDRGVLALQQLRVVDEQARLIRELMAVVDDVASKQLDLISKELVQPLHDRKFYYKASVLHAEVDSQKLSTTGEPPGLRQKVLGAKAGELQIFDSDETDLPTHILEAWKCTVAIQPEKLQLVVKHRPVESEAAEVHVFKLESVDEFNRWFYAFKYAGFLPSDLAKYVPKKPEPKPSPVPPPKPKKTHPIVLMMSPTGKGPDGNRIPFVCDDLPVIFDVPTNTVNFPFTIERMSPLQLDALHTVCVIDPALKEIYLYAFDPKRPTELPTKILLKPKSDEDFDLLLSSAVKMKWKALHIGPDREPTTPKKIVKRVETPKPVKIVKPPKPEPPPPPPKPEPKPEPPPPPPPDPADLFVVENRELKLFEHLNDPMPVLKLSAEDCLTTADDDKREFLLVCNEGTEEEETYVFNFDNDKVFNEKKELLIENGFFEGKKKRVVRDIEKRVNQVCVVQQKVMDMYRHYGSPGDTPLLTMHAQFTVATPNEERREIRLVQTLENGKVEKATLDCASSKEYERWNMALLFGGFLRAETTADVMKMRKLSHLTKYIFPINLFGPAEDDPRCVRVVGNSIMFFPYPDSTDAIFELSKSETEVEAELPQRRFRIFRNRFSDSEDRVDVVMHSASEFDRLKKILDREGFIKDSPQPQRRMSRSHKRFILAKKMNLSVFTDKQAARPALFFRGLDYIGETGTPFVDRYVFIRPREEGEENRLADAEIEIDGGAKPTSVAERIRMPKCRFDVGTDLDLERWNFAFFVARMKRDMKDSPRFFVPSIIFGFSSNDVPIDMGPDDIKSSGSSFFGLRRGSTSKSKIPQRTPALQPPPGSKRMAQVSEAKQRGSIDRPKGAKELPKPSKTKESSASAKMRKVPELRQTPPSSSISSDSLTQYEDKLVFLNSMDWWEENLFRDEDDQKDGRKKKGIFCFSLRR